VVALKAAKWRSWLCFDHFWSPEWSLSGISRQSLEGVFSEVCIQHPTYSRPE
jgi:hypothetical protein